MEEEHVKKAQVLLVKQSQNDSFASEIRSLKAGKPELENSSRLRKIDVYLDSDEIIKLRSRTMKFHGDERRKMNPIILDAKQKIARLNIPTTLSSEVFSWKHGHRHERNSTEILDPESTSNVESNLIQLSLVQDEEETLGNTAETYRKNDCNIINSRSHAQQ